MLAILLAQIAGVSTVASAVIYSAIMMQQAKRDKKRRKIAEKHTEIARRADRDHTRTLRGDPRGMYGEHMPPREVVDIADDDQFIDEWDTCELCPQRGGAVHPGEVAAVWEGERLCKACYRERAYGNRLVDLPVPMPANYHDCVAWLEAEERYENDVDRWLIAEHNWKMRRPKGDNVADFDEARRRLGRQMRATAAVPSYAVGKPEPAARTQAALTAMMQKLVAIGVPMAALQGQFGDALFEGLLEQRCGFGKTLSDCPHLAIPGHREFGHGLAALGPLLQTADCSGCEKMYKHGNPTPVRAICTGNCDTP